MLNPVDSKDMDFEYEHIEDEVQVDYSQGHSKAIWVQHNDRTLGIE